MPLPVAPSRHPGSQERNVSVSRGRAERVHYPLAITAAAVASPRRVADARNFRSPQASLLVGGTTALQRPTLMSIQLELIFLGHTSDTDADPMRMDEDSKEPRAKTEAPGGEEWSRDWLLSMLVDDEDFGRGTIDQHARMGEDDWRAAEAEAEQLRKSWITRVGGT